MRTVVEALAVLLAVESAVAAAAGGWAWWQLRPGRGFWVLLRGSQAVAVALAAAAGVAAALGRRPDDGLFWVYALVPVAVSFVAEQLRVLSAETVLSARGFESAAELKRLTEGEQRSVAMAIVRREVGVMALSALVVCFLALRALGTASGI